MYIAWLSIHRTQSVCFLSWTQARPLSLNKTNALRILLIFGNKNCSDFFFPFFSLSISIMSSFRKKFSNIVQTKSKFLEKNLNYRHLSYVPFLSHFIYTGLQFFKICFKWLTSKVRGVNSLCLCFFQFFYHVHVKKFWPLK